MLGKLVKRIWSRRLPGVPVRHLVDPDPLPHAPAPRLELPVGAEVPADGATSGTASAVPPAGATVASPDGVRDTVAQRVGDLRARFPSRLGSADADLLMDDLTTPSMALRQPPLAARAVLALCRRGNYGLDEMVGLMEKDPAMSQALLRHANSAWYAGHSDRSVLGLKAAIQRVGNQGIHASVMHEIIEGGLSRPGAGLDQVARKVWEHMVRTAPLARDLAPLFEADPEEAFTLALLHDVGKLVFFDGVAARRKELRRDLQLPPDFVSVALRVLHEPLGGAAALHWGLDERVVHLIATHHRTGGHPASETMSEVLYVAERVDIARQYPGTMALERIWETGGLAGPLEEVSAWLVDRWETDRSSAGDRET